jgi:hypothetical protein
MNPIQNNPADPGIHHWFGGGSLEKRGIPAKNVAHIWVQLIFSQCVEVLMNAREQMNVFGYG